MSERRLDKRPDNVPNGVSILMSSRPLLIGPSIIGGTKPAQGDFLLGVDAFQ
jgi:hypothetical protein